MKTIATASHFFIVSFLEPVQDLFCAVCQHHKSSGKNSGILYHQTSRPGQQRKTMLPTSQIGNPHFGGGNKERKRTECHYDRQRSSRQPNLRREYTQKSKDTYCHNQYSKTVGETVGIVLHVPLVFHLIELTLLQFILLVFRRRLVIEETHKRTVCHERNNSLGFIIPEFQAAYPYKYHENGHADQINAQFLGRSGQCQQCRNSFCNFVFIIFIVFSEGVKTLTSLSFRSKYLLFLTLIYSLSCRT